ncbi:MAG TPA: sigma factor-like helix-turn-helix DNA-binding protein [Candidatus Paceibacterota bacterium]
MNSYPYQKIAITLVSDLPDRTRDIVSRRFGLEQGGPETLEAIGQAHGVTRERVRQIVEDGLVQIKERVAAERDRARLELMFRMVDETLKNTGNVKRQDLLVEELHPTNDANHVLFLLHLHDQLYKQKETEHTHAFWVNKKDLAEESPRVLEDLVQHFERRKNPATLEELLDEYGTMNPKTFASLLEVSKHILQGYNGKWGLRRWPEIYPKGVRDKAYVVLRDTQKPLHFVEVAQLIEKLQDALTDQRKRNILPQTVHNELIKDPRFVLVGRGTYGLAEWGYTPGTVKDVLLQILHEAGKALAKEDLVQKTLAQRQVKESTILLNLQDKTCFMRDDNGFYCLPK